MDNNNRSKHKLQPCIFCKKTNPDHIGRDCPNYKSKSLDKHVPEKKSDKHSVNPRCSEFDNCPHRQCLKQHSKLRSYAFKADQFGTADSAISNFVQGMWIKHGQNQTAYRSGSLPHWTAMVCDFDEEETHFFKYQRNQILRTVYGTLEPKIKLKSNITVVNVVSGVMSVDVIPISFANINHIGSWQTLFDEYKFIGPFSIHYSPTSMYYTNTTASTYPILPQVIGVIDYSDAGSLSSLTVDAVLNFDSAQIFHPMTTNANNCIVPKVTWKGHFQGIPDKQWVDINTASIPAWHKCKTLTASSAINVTAVGYYLYKIEIQFRQMA